MAILWLPLLGQFGCTQSQHLWNVRALGAIGDGKTKDTAAFQAALDQCSAAGGGQVVVPAGNYLIGGIELKSHTILQMDKDAKLLGSPDLGDYPMADVRWEGRWVKGHRGLIFALNAQDIGIIGPGHIAGNPAATSRAPGRVSSRGPVVIEPISCRNVRLEEFSTEQRGLWSIHPTYCQNVLAKNLTIRSTGGLGDGIDVDSSRDVRIEYCDIDTGDDAIAIKSGRGMEGFRIARPSEDIVISHCTLGDANFGCIGIGSETSGGVRNVRIEHCRFTHCRTFAIYIKSNIDRGAGIENISAQDLDVDTGTGGFLRLNLTGSGRKDSEPVPGDLGIPFARNFSFADVRVKCGTPIDATMISPVKPLDGFEVTHVTGTCTKGMTMANMVHVELRDIEVSGFAKPRLAISNVTGEGLDGAEAFLAATRPSARRTRTPMSRASSNPSP